MQNVYTNKIISLYILLKKNTKIQKKKKKTDLSIMNLKKVRFAEIIEGILNYFILLLYDLTIRILIRVHQYDCYYDTNIFIIKKRVILIMNC